MAATPLALFALNATREFGARVAQALGAALGAHEEREFEDGEHKARPLESVRGRDVYVLQSLYADVQDAQVPRAQGRAGAADGAQSVNDKLVRLLFFLGCLRDAGAARVTAALPYLAYARKDARTQPRDPVTARYVAQLFEAVGTDRVVALDVHNPAAFQNAFRIRTEHLTTTRLFAERFAALLRDATRVAVVSPDAGGAKRAERLRQALARKLGREDVALGFLEKARARGVMRGGRLVGEVDGAAVVILDDMIGTGGTLAHAAQACKAAGAIRIYTAAAHGLFVGDTSALLGATEIESIAVTDSVPPFRLAPAVAARRLTVLSVAPLFAEAIRRLHTDGSLAELLEG
jgi:ribose-phosphate pyrophosphokinase